MPMRGVSLVPSAVAKALICVDDVVDCDMVGRLYNMYMPEPVGFTSVFGFVGVLDKFFDEMDFPSPYCEDRSFKPKPATSKKIEKEVQQYMPEDIFANEQGKKATFVVQVQFRQNATWQGTITWTDEKKAQRFRSTLEMIKLMDDALAETSQKGGPTTATSWE